ncbi:MAG: reprolysin-like metallopeptidase [Opitutales bacterium]
MFLIWRDAAVGGSRAGIGLDGSGAAAAAAGDDAIEAVPAAGASTRDHESRAAEASAARVIPVLRRAGGAVEWTSRNPAAQRARRVEVNPELLRVADNSLRTGDVLELELFGGRRFRARITRRETWGRGEATFTATARGLDNPHGFLVLSTTGGILRIAVEDADSGSDYQVRFDPAREAHVLLEIDERGTELYGCGNEGQGPTHVREARVSGSEKDGESGAGRLAPSGRRHGGRSHHGHECEAQGCLHPKRPEAAEVEAESAETDSSGDPPEGDSAVDDVILDVLIAYTPAALASEGSLSNLELNLSQSIAIANLVHENSDTWVRLDLVHSVEVPYAESGDAYDDLDAISYLDGQMDEVLWLRDYHGADFVSLFIDTNQVGGIAWRPDAYDRPDQAFSLVRVQQSDSTTAYTTAHEIAHNMGVGHSKTQSSESYDGSGVAGYAAGWQWADAEVGSAYSIGRCSVMTYKNFDGISGYEYDRVAHFSNPEIDYNGHATGDAVHGDAARTIREGRYVYEAFRSLPDYPHFAAFPYEYGFESGEDAHGGWLQTSLDDMDWSLDQTGGTDSIGTGPSEAFEGNRYAYLEASGNRDREGILVAEFDLSALSAPELRFHYHMYASEPAQMGALHVEVSTDGGFEWTELFQRAGNQGDAWHGAEVGLGAYAGETVLLRFRAVVGTGYRSDIALDAIQVGEFPAGDAVESFGTWIGGFEEIEDAGTGTDPDGDGLSNYLEYAFGSQPDSSGSAAAPTWSVDPGAGTVTFRFVRARSNLEYRLESVSSMDHWENPDIEWVSTSPTSANPLVDVGEEQTIEIEFGDPPPQWFLRLTVSELP